MLVFLDHKTVEEEALKQLLQVGTLLAYSSLVVEEAQSRLVFLSLVEEAAVLPRICLFAVALVALVL